MVVGVVGEYRRCSGKGRCGGSGERFGGRGWEVWWERTGVVGGKEGVVGVADVVGLAKDLVGGEEGVVGGDRCGGRGWEGIERVVGRWFIQSR